MTALFALEKLCCRLISSTRLHLKKTGMLVLTLRTFLLHQRINLRLILNHFHFFVNNRPRLFKRDSPILLIPTTTLQTLLSWLWHQNTLALWTKHTYTTPLLSNNHTNIIFNQPKYGTRKTAFPIACLAPICCSKSAL